MKNAALRLTAMLLAAVSILAFCSCAEESEPAALTDSFDLTTIHSPKTDGADEFAGAWTITEGTGSQLESFTFMFDGKGKAYLMIGNMGYVENYTLEDNVFSVQLLFGLDGSYTYEFSENGDEVLLVNADDGSTSTLEKRKNYSYIPEPEKEFSIDDEILGAWKSDEGTYLYFSADGIMYNNSYGISFTFSNYSADNQEITSTYLMKKEITDTLQYSVDGDTITVDGMTYSKIETDELIQSVNYSKN